MVRIERNIQHRWFPRFLVYWLVERDEIQDHDYRETIMLFATPPYLRKPSSLADAVGPDNIK